MFLELTSHARLKITAAGTHRNPASDLVVKNGAELVPSKDKRGRSAIHLHSKTKSIVANESSNDKIL